VKAIYAELPSCRNCGTAFYLPRAGREVVTTRDHGDAVHRHCKCRICGAEYLVIWRLPPESLRAPESSARRTHRPTPRRKVS
jgi:hypothetical protein